MGLECDLVELECGAVAVMGEKTSTCQGEETLDYTLSRCDVAWTEGMDETTRADIRCSNLIVGIAKVGINQVAFAVHQHDQRHAWPEFSAAERAGKIL